MADYVALSRVLRGAEGAPDMLYFRCPGCESTHGVKHGEGGWTWNGSVDAPTFSPSVLVTWPSQRGERRCHSYVTHGAMQFLPECTHAMAGQTVPLLEWPASTSPR